MDVEHVRRIHGADCLPGNHPRLDLLPHMETDLEELGITVGEILHLACQPGALLDGRSSRPSRSRRAVLPVGGRYYRWTPSNKS